MPVTYGNFTKQLKLLPLTLFADGRAEVTVRFGYVGEDFSFVDAGSQNFSIVAEQVSTILDAQPVAGLSRRDDLAYAVYSYLVSNDLIESGTIS